MRAGRLPPARLDALPDAGAALASGDDARRYWDAADRHERANGRVYREVQFALPKELPERRQVALARLFARDLTAAERLPYTLSVASPRTDSAVQGILGGLRGGVEIPRGVGVFVIIGPPADEAVHRACVAKALAEKPAATIDDRVEVSRACYREQGRLVPSASVYEAMERVDQAFWAAARRVTGVFR